MLFFVIIIINFENKYKFQLFIGSYSESLGIEIIRKHVAEYIERRDGQPAVFSNIFCSSGASDAIKVN